MAKPRAVVLRTAGTNCDEETKYAFELAGAQVDLIHINRFAAANKPFADYQILALPGGFTYGDDVAAGKVLAVELTHLIGDHLQEFVSKGGLVIGICNGFQVLVKTGLLPDAKLLRAGERKLTLTDNDSRRFEARWVYLHAPENTVCVWADSGETMELPVAHGEGKLICRSSPLLEKLKANGQVVYQYVAPNGSTPVYPQDPNGSVDHIAGICDPTGRVFGLMPHPERHLFGYHHPRWTRENREGEGEGLKIFKRAVAALA